MIIAITTDVNQVIVSLSINVSDFIFGRRFRKPTTAAIKTTHPIPIDVELVSIYSILMITRIKKDGLNEFFYLF